MPSEDAELPPDDVDRLGFAVSALNTYVFFLTKEIRNLLSVIENQKLEIARLTAALKTHGLH